MTLDIIKAVISNPDLVTNEMIHEALGKGCWHKWTIGGRGASVTTWICRSCDRLLDLHNGKPPPQPDYLGDPCLWWPLLDELLKNRKSIEYSITIEKYYIGWICHKEIGSTICAAWLQMKMEKGEIKWQDQK